MTDLRVDARTRLRSLSAADAEPIFALVDANRAYLREWLPWLDANRSVADTREFIHQTIEQEQQGRGLLCLIEHEREPSGLVGFNTIDRGNRSGEIGYWLRRDRQGRGIVTACVRALVDHAFHVLDLHRIVIPAAVENARSRAIPERLGFRAEGVLRQAEWLYDHFVDLVVYARLREDGP